MATILVTGANGQLGMELKDVSLQNTGHNWIFADRAVLDISDLETVSTFFEVNHVDFCVNCAAYTAVDKAEEEPQMAELVNVTAVENLAKVCKKYQAKLIHISSDYVYHNLSQNTPYKETDPTKPKGIYAATKLKGELLAKEVLPKVIIIRTSWVYSSYGNNFVKTMLKLGKKLPELKVIFDQIGTPTYAKDIALAIMKIIQSVDKQWITRWEGVFNFSNEGVTSWYDFTLAIFRNREIDTPVFPIESKEYPTAAIRPHFSVMNKAKIKQTFGIKIRHWEEALHECLGKIEED